MNTPAHLPPCQGRRPQPRKRARMCQSEWARKPPTWTSRHVERGSTLQVRRVEVSTILRLLTHLLASVSIIRAPLLAEWLLQSMLASNQLNSWPEHEFSCLLKPPVNSLLQRPQGISDSTHPSTWPRRSSWRRSWSRGQWRRRRSSRPSAAWGRSGGGGRAGPARIGLPRARAGGRVPLGERRRGLGSRVWCSHWEWKG